MKIALVGDGKTGHKITQLAQDVTVFNLQNIPTPELLKKHDVIINFTPGPAFLSLIPTFLKSQTPVVSGSTGIELDHDLDKKIKDHKTKWIYGTNFALGMPIIKNLIQIIKASKEIYNDQLSFEISETHHTEKKDKPSGTALTWSKWLGEENNITSFREGDTVGVHTLSLKTEFETISINHTAHDRKIFARGALWAAEKLIGPDLKDGLHLFENVIQNEINL